MRRPNTLWRVSLAAGLAVLSGELLAASWQTLSSEPGRRVEFDNASVSRDGNKMTVSSRVMLDTPLEDLRSGTSYQIIEATTRYDCENKSLMLVKRTLRKLNNELVREEEGRGKQDSNVRSGTVDEKLMTEVCRKDRKPAPPEKKGSEAGKSPALDKLPAQEKQGLKNNASAASSAVQAANDATVQAALQRAMKSVSPRKALARKAEPGHDEHEAAHHGAHAHWAYAGDVGPDRWADLDPANALCRNGQRQSPINIEDGIRLDLEPIQFNYQPAGFQIVDNGHTLQAIVPGNFITLTGKTYRLLQLHFHRPSEERVNGRNYPMVAHLVHQSAEGDLAVVAVLLDEGTENKVIQQFWNYMPLEQNRPVLPPDVKVNLLDLLPLNRAYYTYMGSLTTPPCTEGILWLVLKTPTQVSPEQVANFSRLYPFNARPIQPAAGRLIKESR